MEKLHSNRKMRWLMAICLCLGFARVATAQKKDKPTAGDVVARHLESLGSPQVRADARSRIVKGTAEFRLRVGSAGALSGPAVMASDGRKISVSMQFSHPDYRAEEFAFDGEKTYFGTMRPGTRSGMGQFLFTQPYLVEEGLVGGVLSIAWPLGHLGERQPTLKYSGQRKINGRPAHELTYLARRSSGDVGVKLYFDAENFRHLMSTYKITPPRQMGATPEQSARQLQVYLFLEETFEDFQRIDGLDLPARWTVRFSSPGSPRGNDIWEWTFFVQELTLNPAIEPTIFVLKQP